MYICNTKLLAFSRPLRNGLSLEALGLKDAQREGAPGLVSDFSSQQVYKTSKNHCSHSCTGELLGGSA